MSTADLALVVAAYAALVSTGTLAWQIHVRLQQRKTDVSVTVRHAGPFGRMMVESYEHPPRAAQGRMQVHAEYELLIVVVNQGETTEVIEAIGIDPQADAGGHLEPPFWYRERNESLPPGATIKHPVPVAQLMPGGNPAGLQFVAYAALASGLRVEAPPDYVTPDFVRLGEQNSPRPSLQILNRRIRSLWRR